MQTQQIPGPASSQDSAPLGCEKFVTQDKVEQLFMVEKLIVQEFLGESARESHTVHLSDLHQKLSQVESGKSLTKEKLEFLLSHLPFVLKTSDMEFTVMNLKAIAPSKQGGAQCFLVVELCQSVKEETTDKVEKASISTISNFVSSLPYSANVKVLDSGDEELSTNQIRFLADAHTFALAVQARIASDKNLSRLTKSYLE